MISFFRQSIIITIQLGLMMAISAQAQIATDGSVGPAQNLAGPDYQIGAELGQQLGGNLFHSFQEFNLQRLESATFSGSNHIQNVISRVTGGNPSQIDGLIRSTIPNADMYFLNPYGILFGPNASLDVQGSFHASTADYLRFGDGGIFHARNPNEGILTIASIESFGFLDNPMPISIQGSFIQNDGQTLSFIGGDLQIEDSILFASGGRINLAAVASEGEVILSSFGLEVNTFEKLGTIKLSQSSSKKLQEWSSAKMLEDIGLEMELANLDVSDLKTLKGAGQIFIRAGQFVSNKSWIFADTYGNENGLGIDIVIDGDMHLINGAKITADNFGNSLGGHIKITTNALLFSGQNSEVESYLNSLSTIATNNKYGIGTSGNISIETPFLEISPGLIQSATKTIGNAGNIFINAQQLSLQNSGFINAGTTSYGQAGNIIITANHISLSNESNISASTATNSSGHAGNIQLETQQLTLTNGSEINNFSKGNGNAGSIHLIAEQLSLTNASLIATSAFQTGGGNITVNVHDRLYLADSEITAQAGGDKPQDKGGNLSVSHPQFVILDKSQLHADAFVGDGGNINVNTNHFIRSNESIIDVSSEFGLEGQIKIDSPDEDLNHMIYFSQFKFLAAERLTNRCAGLTRENLSQFIITIRDVLPPTPMDLNTHYYFPED